MTSLKAPSLGTWVLLGTAGYCWVHPSVQKNGSNWRRTKAGRVDRWAGAQVGEKRDGRCDWRQKAGQKPEATSWKGGRKREGRCWAAGHWPLATDGTENQKHRGMRRVPVIGQAVTRAGPFRFVSFVSFVSSVSIHLRIPHSPNSTHRWAVFCYPNHPNHPSPRF